MAAVIVRDLRVLLEQRPPHETYPLFWGSPGGGVQVREDYSIETHQEALERELREEFALESHQVRVGIEPIAVVLVDDVRLHFYPVKIEGYPAPQEGQGWGWFRAHEMRHLNLTPGNMQALSAIDWEISRS